MKNKKDLREKKLLMHTCSVELDEWLKRMGSDKSAMDKFRSEVRRNPKRYRDAQEDS